MIEFNWINNCITLARIFVFSKWFRKKIKKDSQGKSLYILANGPSLNSELDNLGIQYLNNKDCLAVNYFASSEVYEQIKPINYVLSAPDVFFDAPAPSFVDKNEKLFKDLNEMTGWKMNLYVPMLAKKYKNWLKKLDNPNIEIHYYNTTVAEGSFWLVKLILKHQLGMPRLQNVLIPALVLMINRGYKKIYLLGVDHSWLKQIHVTDQNEVLMTHKHFYSKSTVTLKVNKGKNESDSRKLHEVLHKFYHTFRSYFILKRYAEFFGASIYNLTKESYIDAFERKEIEKLLKDES